MQTSRDEVVCIVDGLTDALSRIVASAPPDLQERLSYDIENLRDDVTNGEARDADSRSLMLLSEILTTLAAILQTNGGVGQRDVSQID